MPQLVTPTKLVLVVGSLDSDGRLPMLRLVRDILKQRWFQKLLFWFAIYSVVMFLVVTISTGFLGFGLLMIAFWGWVAYAMRRKLKAPQ